MNEEPGKSPIKVAVIGLGRRGKTVACMVERRSGLAFTTHFARSEEKRGGFAGQEPGAVK